MSEVKYGRTQLRSKNQDPNKPRRKLGRTKLVVNKQPIDLRKLAHAAKNIAKVIEACEQDEYSRANGESYRGGRSYDRGMSNRMYSRDGYYYDDGGGMSTRRGRAANGRFVSRDAGGMARQLREMMEQAEDDYTRSELQRLADKMEQM